MLVHPGLSKNYLVLASSRYVELNLLYVVLVKKTYTGCVRDLSILKLLSIKSGGLYDVG